MTAVIDLGHNKMLDLNIFRFVGHAMLPKAFHRQSHRLATFYRISLMLRVLMRSNHFRVRRQRHGLGRKMNGGVG
ncbi:MAG: hypothetical protein DMG04_12035 [Acidobacteria bacterium]|nr:MAG: hypothetical protein DMG04_12035 [Acidobacteriota bacterium]PYQ87107.1 MAG: hypothetical protein DMG02_21655 [Acidobacteriota bacterium]PYQ89051.1 MAG: hypothetical protein DMG03_02305 [Acidobacteriota bacterium]PYR07889.1 MAG: hypothetical protein DMF99_21235 [Acidobacteriota bacterium]